MVVGLETEEMPDAVTRYVEQYYYQYLLYYPISTMYSEYPLDTGYSFITF